MSSFYETEADRNDYMLIFPFTSSSVGAHFHKSLEFVYCLEGKTEFFIDGTRYVLNKDEIYAVPSYSVHYNKNLGENKILSFVFAHHYFHDFEKSYPNLIFPPILTNQESNRKIRDFLEDFFHFFVKNDYNYQNIPFLKRQAIINEFLYELVKIYPLEPLNNKKLNNVILDILTYINLHYKEQLTVNIVADHFGYCPQYFSEIFNKHVGCNFNTYINNIRIENVLNELKTPNNKKTLTSIVFDHGFNSLATFYRALNRKKENH